MDLSTQLDRAIGPAPDGPPPLPGLLADGRRAVRRRRLALASAVAAVVVPAGGATALATGGSHPAATPVATDPSPSAPAAAGPRPTAAQMHQALGLVTWHDGQWSLDPRATVLREVDDPYRLAPPGGSVGLEVRWQGTVIWIATWLDPVDGSTPAATSYPGAASSSFETWVSQQHATDPPGTFTGRSPSSGTSGTSGTPAP